MFPDVPADVLSSGLELFRDPPGGGRPGGPVSMATPKQWSGQGEEGLDNSTNQSVGKQQAGPRKPGPGRIHSPEPIQ